MTIHSYDINDLQGNMVEIQWYCSESCYRLDGHTGDGYEPMGGVSEKCTFCRYCNKFVLQGRKCEILNKCGENCEQARNPI